MNRSNCWAIAVLASAGLMQGCATTTTTTVPWGQSAEKDGIVFEFLSASTTREIRAPYGQRVTPTNDSFVRVEVQMLNKTKEPVSYGQQPVFRLVDEGGTRYDVNSLQTIVVNTGRPNGSVTGPINPNVKYAKEIVFEVPRGRQYVLEVTVPTRIRTNYGPAGVRSKEADFRVALPPASQPPN